MDGQNEHAVVGAVPSKIWLNSLGRCSDQSQMSQREPLAHFTEGVLSVLLMEHPIPHHAQGKAVEAAVSDTRHYFHCRELPKGMPVIYMEQAECQKSDTHFG